MLASILFGVVLFTPSAPVPKELKRSQPVDFEKLVASYDAMSPETAAKHIEELCDQGLMENGLRILEKKCNPAEWRRFSKHFPIQWLVNSPPS